jgi:electron transfer flavoprotein alpha/beta subunit
MPKKKDLQLSELPLNTRFKRKPRKPNVKAIRQKAKISVAFYDADHYGVTLKRGITIVKKAKMPIKGQDMAQAEKAIRAEIMKGTFDVDLIDGYQRIMASRKRRKGK